MKEIIECVVNISEGQRQHILNKISASIKSVDHTILSHVDIGYDANRTVFTFFTTLDSLGKTIFNIYETAFAAIQMDFHTGKHPRLGIVDVCPFIPIKGITKEKLIPVVDKLARQIGDRFDIPVYLYEDSSPVNRRLESIRQGEYESLEPRLLNQDNLPDYGSFKNYKTHGGTIMGVRSFLLAYNINLETDDISIAKDIAKRIRGSGYKSNGQRVSGKFKSVKAIGWYIKEYGFAQVSTNLTDYHQCCFHDVFETSESLANELGTSVTGSELIGLCPKEALLISGKYYSNDANEENIIQAAISNLGLDQLEKFIPEERIVELVLNRLT